MTVSIAADDITMVVLAAGVGDRAGNGVPKQFVRLGDIDDPDRTPLDLVLASYETVTDIGSLVVVCSEPYREQTEAIAAKYDKPIRIINGGETRHDSLYQGVEAVETEIMGIHDAARPLLWEPALDAAIKKLHNGSRAVTTAVHPYASMLACVEDGPISGVLERWDIAHTVAPAFYYTADLLEAWQICDERGLEYRDEPAMIMATLPDIVIETVEGHRSCFKLTYPEDFDILAAHRRQKMEASQDS